MVKQSKVAQMISLGYILLVTAFLLLIAIMLAKSIKEAVKPEDPGPLFIDLLKTINEREEPMDLKETMYQLIRDAVQGKNRYWQTEMGSGEVNLRGRGNEEIKVSFGKLKIKKGLKIKKVLVVMGNLETEENVELKNPVYVLGETKIGLRNKVNSLTSTGKVTIGDETMVKGFIDSNEDIEIGENTVIKGKVTSEKKIRIGRGTQLKQVYAKEILIETETSHRKERMQPEIKIDLNLAKIYSLEEKGKIGRELIELREKLKPEYLKNRKTWIQGANTLRIKGNLQIPSNQYIPYNLIVEGNLKTGRNTVFAKGLCIKGNAEIGPENTIGESIKCHGNLEIRENCTVQDCIDCEGNITIDEGAEIGIGDKGGAIIAYKKIYLSNATVRNKIYAEEGIEIKKAKPKGRSK